MFEKPGWNYSLFSYSSDQRGLSPLWVGVTHFFTEIAWLLMVKDESGKTDFAGHMKEFDFVLRTMASLQRFVFFFSSAVSWCRKTNAPSEQEGQKACAF